MSIMSVTEKVKLPRYRPFAKAVTTMATQIPWEQFLLISSSTVSLATHLSVRKTPEVKVKALPPSDSPAVGTTGTPPNILKPGCTAADGALLARGHLEGLSKGYGGFGVLRVSKEKLEEAARAAEHLGQTEIAQEMRSIASEMPEVHDAETAGKLAERLGPVVESAWNLGRKCKGVLSNADIEKARMIAHRIHSEEKAA